MLQLLALFGSWLIGLALLFLWVKNKNRVLVFHDVVASYLLSTVIGFVAAFAGEKANLFHWVTCIIYSGGGFYFTYKFLDKKVLTSPTAQGFLGASKFPAGSMGAADEKGAKIFKLVAGIIYLIVILCLTVIHTDLSNSFHRAGSFVNIAGIISILASYILILRSDSVTAPAHSGTAYWVAILILLAGGLALSCGFNFDLTTFGAK